MACVQGKIVKGRGIGKSVIEKINNSNYSGLPILFKGTLNIVSDLPVFFNYESSSIKIGNFYFFPIYINGVDCFVIKWRKCPAHIFEVVSEYNLSYKINIKEGSRVTLEIDNFYIYQKRLCKYVSWFLVWKFRENLYYSNNYYQFLINKSLNIKYQIINYSNRFK